MHGEVFQEGEGLVLREESFEDVTGAVYKVLPETPAVVGALAVAPPPFPYQLFLEGGEAVVPLLLVGVRLSRLVIVVVAHDGRGCH